jgi:hypothetical protein
MKALTPCIVGGVLFSTASLIGANRLASAVIQSLNASALHRQLVITVLDNAAMMDRAVSGVQMLGAPHIWPTVAPLGYQNVTGPFE